MIRHAAVLALVLALAPIAPGQSVTVRPISPSPAAPKHLPGFRLVQDSRGVYWWHRRAGEDGMARATWDYWVTQTRPGVGDPPLAVVAPSQVVASNFGLDLQAFSRGPEAPGFSGGGGSAGPSSDDANPAPDADESDTPADPTDPGADPLDLWLRNAIGVDLITVYVLVGCGVLITLALVAVLALAILVNRRR